MKQRLALTVILLASGALAACGKSSRFDDQAVVDVCAIVDPVDAEGILGEPVEPPTSASAPGFAGACRWRFVASSGDRNAELSVAMLTHASNARQGQGLGNWFEMNMTALKAAIDIHPRALNGVGDRAFLFDSGTFGGILMRQSQTFLMLRTTGATATQLEAFARLLGAAAEKKDAAAAAKAPQRVADARASAAPEAAAAAPQRSANARPQEDASAPPVQTATASGDGGAKKDDVLVLYTIGYVEECTRADNLLRAACARWGPQLRADLQHNCELPAATFEARTADAYRAFKENFRERIAASEPALSTSLAQAQAEFDRQFAQEVAGNMVGFDVERLSRLLGRECTAIESEWLTQRP